MGYFEASIVVYLRELFYPEGFTFPMKDASTHIILVELGREIMSVGMLIAVAALAGRSFIERFSMFCCMFGIWDIFYYIFLKLTLGWPESLLTWDILYLIPVPWIGPVWAPVLCSICFIAACLMVVYAEDHGFSLKPNVKEWAVAIAGGLIIIVSFCEETPRVLDKQKPESFAWRIFFPGLILGLLAFASAWKRMKKQKNPPRP